MSICTIKKGRHYPVPPPLLVYPWVGEPCITRRVRFDESAIYDSTPYHADDVNKLFGLSFGWRGVHYNSARFGWRWSQRVRGVELLAYAYLQGKKNWDAQLRYPVVATVQPGQDVWCRIGATSDMESGIPIYDFEVDAPGQPGRSTTVIRPEVPRYGLTHGPYWGGQIPAPHDYHVSISRL